MNVLIYLGHPAQFHFSKNIILQLKSHGHQVKVLIKTKDVLEDLLKLNGFEYENIQKIPRKNNQFSILIASFARTFMVVRIAKKFHADILMGGDASISQAGFLLRRPGISVLEDDIEVIEKLARVSFPFSSSIVAPEVCNVGKWQFKKVSYPGYMKLSYLHPNRFTPDERLVRNYIVEKKYCLIRLAQLTAHHDIGIKGLNIQLVKYLIEIAEKYGYVVYISSEGALHKDFLNYQLKINQSEIHHIMASASLLVSDSQSMSVESAVLGVPAIRFSDFSGRISVLEELEHSYGLTYGFKTSDAEEMLKKVEELLATPNLNEIWQERRQKMLADKIDVSSFFTWFLENYPLSVKVLKENPSYMDRFK